jgi:hypothetical protein
MDRFNTHKGITYELREIQGFYYCLVYPEGESTALFATSYLSSAQAAELAAKDFIDGYDNHRKSSGKKAPRPSKPRQEVRRAISSKPKQGIQKRQREDKKKTKPSIKTKTKRVSQTSKHLVEESITKSKAINRKRKTRAILLFLLLGSVLAAVTVVVDNYSEAIQASIHRNLVMPIMTETASPVVEITPSPPIATIALPKLRSSQTLAPTTTSEIAISSTSTNTSAITSAITTSPTQPTVAPTKTDRPANTPRPTKPAAPTSTFTPRPTATFTPLPTATFTPIPTATSAPPTDTPPPWSTPITPSPTP